MIILARVKDKGCTCGYIIELDDKRRKYETSTSIDKYNPQNAIKVKNGEWKAKDGYRIPTIAKCDITVAIENRNTYIVGKPNLIYNYTFAKLSKTQQILLNKTENEKMIFIDKHKENINITMKDLSAMTAYTGVEFSLFGRNDKFVLVKGTSRGITLTHKESTMLLNNKYTWIGHTHPGNSFNCMTPSDSDYDTLKYLNQKRSVIYNSVGDYYVFGEETDI